MIQIYHLYVGIRKILTNSDATVIQLNIDNIELVLLSPLHRPLPPFVPVVSIICILIGKRIAKIHQRLTSEATFSALTINPAINHPTQTPPDLYTSAAHSC